MLKKEIKNKTKINLTWKGNIEDLISILKYTLFIIDDSFKDENKEEKKNIVILKIWFL